MDHYELLKEIQKSLEEKTEDLKEDIKECERAVREYSPRLAKVETNQVWLKRGITGVFAFIAGIVSWIIRDLIN